MLNAVSESYVIHWFRRDLRTEDNASLYRALNSGYPVRCIFIFDPVILDPLPDSDQRVRFIMGALRKIRITLRAYGSDLWIYFRNPAEVFRSYASDSACAGVFAARDYEPYARQRDEEIYKIFKNSGKNAVFTDDQVIFPPESVLKSDGKPYTVFTPYKKKWLETLFRENPSRRFSAAPSESLLDKTEKRKGITGFPERFFRDCRADEIGLPEIQTYSDKDQNPLIPLNIIKNYKNTRDFPHIAEGTSRMGVHLRFGTVSIRKLAAAAFEYSETYLSELIWREFFFQILYHFPFSAEQSFRAGFRNIRWINDPELISAWKEGRTGFPVIDAGMRELNKTGFMHNRVRMITASFLVKHLLTDWKIGERYFAEKLMDFDLSANAGNWQWAAGTGCDAAPYFRIFNPHNQQKKFDPDFQYIKQWAPEYFQNNKLIQPYPEIVNLKAASARALSAYKQSTLNQEELF